MNKKIWIGAIALVLIGVITFVSLTTFGTATTPTTCDGKCTNANCAAASGGECDCATCSIDHQCGCGGTCSMGNCGCSR